MPIEQLSDLPAGVIGFAAHGKLEADDYKNTLLPAVNKAVEAGELRILLVMREFDGISPGGIWEDLKMGMSHLTAWKKVAFVTDIEWMVHAVSLFGWMTPGEMKRFPVSEQADALAWVAA